MFIKLLTIAKNTFIETIRQPIYAVIIVFALILMLLAPSISMYTLDEDVKLLRELGLSTLFLAGLFIAVFAATSTITEEIESGTITTVLSKPISRSVFVVGKFFGVAGAVTMAHALLTMSFLMATRHGVLETASDEIDWTVITAAALAFGGAFLLTALINYIYDWNFSSTAIVLSTIFCTFAIIFLLLVDKHWKFNPSENQFETFDLVASVLLLMAIILLVALATLFSTRFNEVLTLTFCVGFFLLGLISDWAFGRFAVKNLGDVSSGLWDKAGILLAKAGVILIPNLQIFWVSDAIYEKGSVPADYLIMAAVYTVLYTVGILALAIAFFQKRQVG
ncbi:MAG: ABC transporter permease [Planctomycetaceae bacterium]|nr:ABC transporter permease [Planctomycetaceae bacterium]